MKLLNVCSPTPGFSRFMESLKRNKGEFEHQLVLLDHYPGNAKKWSIMPKGLTGQLIVTDTDDVIYQGGLPQLAGIVTAPENVLHKDTVWKKFCVGEYETLLDKPVYNSGTFSMPAEEFYDLVDFIVAHQPVYPANDQIHFNLWLLNKIHTPRIDCFCPLYDNFSRMSYHQDWYFDETVPAFIHSNGIKHDLHPD